MNPESRVRLARNRSELDALIPVWERAQAGGASPMQRLAWTLACLDTIEHDSDLHVFALETESGAAVAPLAWRRSISRFELVGLDTLGEPADLVWSDEATLHGLVAAIAATGRTLELGRMPIDSPTLRAVRAGYRNGFVYQSAAGGTPTIALDPSWADPESQLSSRRRSDLRRAHRRAEAAGEVTSEVLAPSAEEVPDLLAEAMAIEARSWKGRSGSALMADADRRAFFERYAAAAAADGTLRLAFLRIGGRGAAMQIAVETGGRYWLLKIGYDEEFARSSPGNLLVLDTLRYAAEVGLEGYEMLGNAEPWTEAWTKRQADHVRVRAYPPRPAGLHALAHDGVTSTRRAWHRRGRPALKRRLAPATEAVARRASRSYVAGDTLDAALSVSDRITRKGHAVTVGYWNHDGEEPNRVASEYASIAGALAARKLDGYISAKPPALEFHIDHARHAAEAARDAGVKLHFDSHAITDADRTLELIATLREHGVKMGVTLPGRWTRSIQDAAVACELGVNVRVVKGQWPDPADPSRDMRKGYLDVIDALAGRSAHVSVATHDAGLLQEGLRRLGSTGTSCEAELLYGLPLRPGTTVAAQAGVPLRVYVPYGAAWLPYALREIRHNPRTLWWLVRDGALRRRGSY